MVGFLSHAVNRNARGGAETRSRGLFSAFSAAPRDQLVDARPKGWHDGLRAGRASPRPSVGVLGERNAVDLDVELPGPGEDVDEDPRRRVFRKVAGIDR